MDIETLRDEVHGLENDKAEAEKRLAKEEGRRATLVEQLKAKHGVDSVEAAEKLLKDLRAKRDKKQTKADALAAELDELLSEKEGEE